MFKILPVIGGVIALFIISWELTLSLLTPMPFLLIFIFFYGRYIRRLGGDIQEALGYVKKKKKLH